MEESGWNRLLRTAEQRTGEERSRRSFPAAACRSRGLIEETKGGAGGRGARRVGPPASVGRAHASRALGVDRWTAGSGWRAPERAAGCGPTPRSRACAPVTSRHVPNAGWRAGDRCGAAHSVAMGGGQLSATAVCGAKRGGSDGGARLASVCPLIRFLQGRDGPRPRKLPHVRPVSARRPVVHEGRVYGCRTWSRVAAVLEAAGSGCSTWNWNL